MLASTQDRAVIELGTILMQLFAKSMAQHLSTDTGVRRAVDDHRRILSGLKSRDREKTRDAIMRSYQSWSRYIRIGKEDPLQDGAAREPAASEVE